MEVRNGRAFPSVHALMIEPFKTIWEADPTPQKDHAIKVFSYAELMCSPKKSNTFLGYSEEMRSKKVLKEIYNDENKPITEFMTMAVIGYKEQLAIASPTYELLETGLVTKDKMVKFLKGVNLNERSSTGAMVIKVKEVNEALKQRPEINKQLIANRDKVQFELEDAQKVRNNREIGLFER